jgi:hypothetical protein
MALYYENKNSFQVKIKLFTIITNLLLFLHPFHVIGVFLFATSWPKMKYVTASTYWTIFSLAPIFRLIWLIGSFSILLHSVLL